MARVVRCYGASRKRCLSSSLGIVDVPCSLAASLGHMRAEFTVKKEEMSWEDVVDDYAKTSEVVEEDNKEQEERIALHKKRTSPSRESPETTKKHTKRSSDEAALAAMTKRRKACKKNGKMAKADRETNNLIELCLAWRAWDNHRREKDSLTGGKLGVGVKRVCDVASRDKALASLATGANCRAHAPCGTTTPLHCIASISCPEARAVLSSMLNSDAAPLDLCAQALCEGGGPLDVALEHGNVYGVLAIIRAGGVPMCKPSKADGACTLIEFAALNGFLQEAAAAMVKFLFAAVESSDASAVRVMLSHGMRPDVKDALGRTPLLVCVEGGHRPAVAQALLECGADANGRDRIGVPIAVYALLRQERATFALLAQYGLQPSATEESCGESVYDAAVANGWTRAELAELFPHHSR